MTAAARAKKSTTVRSERTLRWARAGLRGARAVSSTLGADLALRIFTTPRRFERPAREVDLLATGHRSSVEVALTAPHARGAHRRVATWRWGSGPTVLLVHGWEGRGGQLGAFVQPLVDAGLSVVAFDAVAHGDSGGRRLYLSDMADVVAAVARTLPDLHAIVAHSFGCAATMLAYHRHGLDVPRNVFVAPNAVIERVISRFHAMMALDPAAARAFDAALEAAAGVPLAALATSALTAGRDAGLLVIHDEGDQDVPFVDGQALAAAWNGARFVPTTGLGHRRILRDPAVVRAVVREARRGATRCASDLIHALPAGWQDARL